MAGSDPASVVEGHWAAWGRSDYKGSLALCAPDVVFSMYIPEDVLPFGGETCGRAAASDRSLMIFSQFDVTRFDGVVLHVDGNIVHGRVEYCFRHKATGEEIEGTMRHVIRVENGLMADVKEYHDAERVRAFMRLVSYRAAER